MDSRAYKWLVKQYRFVLNRMHLREYLLEEHPLHSAPRAAQRVATFAGSRLNLDRLENRVMLSSAPLDDHLDHHHLAHAPAAGQVFFIDVDGASDVDYDGPVAVNDIDIPAFAAPGALAGQESAVLDNMLGALDGAFGDLDVQFTLERPVGTEFSTIYIGGDGSAFPQWGQYYGIAEQIDVGNADARDAALVFPEAIDAAGASAVQFGHDLAEIVAHEAGHLLGFAHADGGDHDHAHSDATPLADVAFDPKVHVEIGKDAVADAIDDGKVTINGGAYTVHPKLVAALQNHPAYYNAGSVGPDGFPDVIMGQFAIHPIDHGTWLNRILDMAWKAQTDASFTPLEQSQILAYAYGYLTHTAGDHWAHTLVNEFAEGVAPGVGAAGASIPTDQRDLANMLRHFMTEAYIADAMPGIDHNKDRTVLPDGDVSDDSTPGIDYEAPIRFIYETLIRPFPDDPTPIVEMDWEGGTLTANGGGANTFVRTEGDWADDGFKAGHKITVSGFTTTGNNQTFLVTSVTPTTLTVNGPLTTENASGDEKIVVKVAKTISTNIGVNAAASKFTRTSGSFMTDGFVPGMRFSTHGFTANTGDYIVKSVTDSELEVHGKLLADAGAGGGNEQLVGYGQRGPVLDKIFEMRDKLFIHALTKGARGPAGTFGNLVANLIDKALQGQTIDSAFKEQLFKEYLYNWVDEIDEGVRHWGEVGLAFTKAMFDPQSRRDLQNKVGASKGADTLTNTLRANAEAGVGIMDIFIEELDDPNGDGKTGDSFINQHLLAMAGLPAELGIVRQGLQIFGDAVGDLLAPLNVIFNPVKSAIADVKKYAVEFIEEQIKERWGFDFATFDYLKNLSAKMDLKSIDVFTINIPVFKPGDHEKLDAYLGLTGSDHHEDPPLGFDSFPGVTFHTPTEGVLKDDAFFDKTAFAGYKNSVQLTKMMFLMEEQVDADTTSAGQLSALYTALSGGPYDFTKLNIHGAHGGNVLTSTLPVAGSDYGTKPWLNSIDADQVWRADNYTITNAKFRVSNQNDTLSPAEWKWAVPNGEYKIYATWQFDVTQDVDNLTNPLHPDQKLKPASDAKYTVLDDLAAFPTLAVKDQRLQPSDLEHEGLGYALLGTYTITNGVIRVRLSNLADGNVVAGPIVIEALSGGAKTVVQNGRDINTLGPLPPADDYVDNSADWIDLVYPSGTGNNPLWESATLRPVFRQLFTDWRNGTEQFPALGDTTSPDPNSSIIPTTEAPSHATPFGPPTPDNVVMVPIPDSLKNAILNGLNSVMSMVETIEGIPPLNVKLPVLDKSIADVLGMSEKVDQRLRQPIVQYFAADPTPTVNELFEVIKAQLDGRMDNHASVLEFDVDLRAMFTVDDIVLALGEQANDAGFSLDAKLSAQAAIAFVDALESTLPKLTFGVDFTPETTTPIGDRVYVKADRVLLSADVESLDIDAAARFGFLGVGVQNGTIDLEADAEITFVDPNLDGKITLTEIANTTLDDLVDVTFSGSLTGSLPITVQAGLAGMPAVSIGTITFDAAELFNLSTYNVDFSTVSLDALQFNNIDAASLVGLLGKLTFWLDEFRRSDEFKQLDLPLVGPALDQVLGFADAFRDKALIDDNDDDLDGPQTLLNDINAALAQAGLAGKVRAEKASGDKIKLILNDASISQFSVTASAPLGFGAQTSSGLATDVFESITATSAVPANGKLSGNAKFSLSFDGGDPVEVRLYKTTGPATSFDGAAGVDPAADQITLTGHGMTTGDAVRYDAGGGTVVPGLNAGGTYYVISTGGNTLKLATSLANATAGTAVDITGDGAGAAHTVSHPFNTDDNVAIGNDKWKLVDADNAATFDTVQQMVLKLTEVVSAANLAYDSATDKLTFSLDLNETFGTRDLPINFNFDNLEPLLGLQSSGNIRLSASGELNLTFGVYLGNAPSSTKLDLLTAFSALNNNVHVKTEQLITAAQDVKAEYGRLSGDAMLKLEVDNSGTLVDITVTKASTDTNTTVADLVADVQAALPASVNSKVQAVADGLKVVLKGIGGATAIKLTAESTNPAVRDLGFSAEQIAQPDAAGVLKISARDQLPFAVGKLAADAVFQITVNSIDGGSPVTVTVDDAVTSTNRNLLDVIGDVQKAIDAVIPPIPAVPASGTTPAIPERKRIKVGSLGRKLTFTATDPTASSFTITAGATNPAVTVFGLAASNLGNSDEFTIYTRDGGKHGVSLDGVSDLQGLFAAIFAQTNNTVTASIDDKQLGIKLTDGSTTGTAMFRVETANGTTAAIDLGILKQDAPEPIQGIENEAPDGVIDGSSIGGIKLTDRFFIEQADVSLNLQMTTPEPLVGGDGDADPNDGIKASANFGFVGIKLAGGGQVTADLDFGLKNPDPSAPTGAPISLTQLIDNLDTITNLVKTPTLTGGGSIDLAVSIDGPPIPGLNMDADAPIKFEVIDLGNPFTGDLPSVNLDLSALGDLIDFENLEFNFQTIIDGLKTLAEFLQSFESFGFLNDPLPLIDVSVNDLIDIADKFAQAIDDAESNPAGTLQLLEKKIKEAFGIPLTGPGSDLFKLELVSDNNGTTSDTDDDFQILKFDLNLGAAFNEAMNLDFQLPGGLSLGGAADLSVAGAIDLDLELGLRLDDPSQIYIFKNTGLSGSLDVIGSNLTFNAAVGPFGVFVKNGSVDIGGALAGGKLFDVDFDGVTFVNDRVLLSTITGNLGAAFDPELDATVAVALPVYFPSASKFAGTINFNAGIAASGDDLVLTGSLPTATDANGVLVSDIGSLFVFDPSQMSILDGLLLGVDGVDLFLEGLQDLLDGELFSVDLPLIGDKFSHAADVIGDFRAGFVADFRAAMQALANPAAAYNAFAGSGEADPVSKILFELLGPIGLDLLKDAADPGTDVTVADVTFTSNINDPAAAPEALFFDWDFELGDTIDASAGIGFDVGIPGLGLETSGEVKFDLDWALKLGFGINLNDGFYFDIDKQGGELQLKADVTVPGGGITGTLGFLQLSAIDNPNGDTTATHLGATFALDIVNRKKSNDTKLSFSELGGIGVNAGLAAEAVVDLGAKLSLGSDLIPNAATNFPSIVADFRLEWALGNRGAGTYVGLETLDGGFLSNGLQFVGFENVGLDLGSYFSDLIGPIVEKVQEITDPIKPFLDFLTTPIPVISDLAGPTTLLDIAALSGAINPGIITAIEVIDEVVDIANSLSSIGSGAVILYFDQILPDGTFTIYDASASAASGDGEVSASTGGALPDLSNPNLDLSGLAENLPGWVPAELQAALGAVTGALKDATNKMLPGGSASEGFSLPIINEPSQIFGMLLGQPAVLVQYDMAPLGVKADFSAFFSIFGPLGVSINAEFEALIDFSFGYDTQGVQDFAASGFRNPELLFNGFFVNDMDATGKIDVAELQFDAGLWAAAELKLGIARGGVGGGLFAEIDFNLHDPNHDGRVRLSELATNFLNELNHGEPLLSPLAIFDVTGSLTAKLFAFLKIDLGLFSIDEKFNITPPLELLNFNIPFTRYPTLATELDDGVLQLNMGQFAAERIEGDKVDGDERFFVKSVDATHVAVWAPDLGVPESDPIIYEATSRIIALGGEGNDTINMSGVTGNIGFEIEGGAGNDTILAGTAATGASKILGGGGNDTITGAAGSDVIFGEAGDDSIDGGGGTDWVFGDGSVKDSIQAELDQVNPAHPIIGYNVVVEPKLNDGNDTLKGGDGTNLIFGAGGADSIEGGAQNDVLIGDGGKVHTNASRIADAVEDTDGGKGAADFIKGDAGADSIFGGFGGDDLQGGSENDQIHGQSGADSIAGNDGNDTIFAGTQNDSVDGGANNDEIFGDAGHDDITGGTEDDSISGGTGVDTLAGAAGHDTVFGDSDDDAITGGDGDDFLEGGHGNDVATGGIGNDTLVAGYASDVIDGQSGNDSYNISARGGASTESTIAYDSGPLTDTDILTVNGTGEDDTFLLRAMADAYFPTQDRLLDFVANILNSGKEDKLALLQEGITNLYGVHGVPASMLDAVETAFDDNPIVVGNPASVTAAITAVSNAVANDYVEETLTLIKKKIEEIDGSPLTGAAKHDAMEQAIIDLYTPKAVPTGMLADLEAAFNADEGDLAGFLQALDDNYVTGEIGQDTAFVALLNDGGTRVERFNYRNMEGLILNTLHGNDYVASDDAMAAATINLGLGNDRAQVGQVFSSPRTDNPETANIATDDVFATVAITRGFLSAGVSRPTVINGGDGADEMTVFHNTAVLNLNGGDGDDLFTVRAFALAGSTDSERARTDMKGDGGADTIRYALNAPVGIDGGDGFDTIRIVGTEFSDDFVVTDSGVFGAGLNVSYVNIEKLVADGAEGDDRFFVLSTGVEVVTEIDGGLGSDSFFVGGAPGNAPIPVISDDFKGHSGVILHSVESDDSAYGNVKVEGISANIADDEEAFLIVTESGGSSSVTEDATSGGIGFEFDTYKIRLSRAPQTGKNVLVKLVDSGMPPEDQAKKFKDLEFFNPATATWVTAQNFPGLTFTSGNNDWKNGLEVKFRAASDSASEGERFTFVNHTTDNSTDPLFRQAKLLSVKARITDDDRASVSITGTDGNNTVLENGFTDKLNVVLTRKPTANVTVTLDELNGQVSVSDPTLVFTTSNWNVPQTVTITAAADTTVEGFHTDFISATVSSADVDVVKDKAMHTVDADLLLAGVQEIVPAKPTSFLFLEHRPIINDEITILYDADGSAGLGAPIVLQPFNGETDPELRYSITGNTLTFHKNGNAASISGKVQATYQYLERGYNNLLVKDTAIDIYDNDAAMVIVRQSEGSTDVLEGGYTDKYSVVLSKAPAAGKTVTIHVDAIKTRTTLDGDAEFKEQVTVDGLSATTLTFDASNWNTPQEVTVAAIDDTFRDGSETQVFAPELQTVNKIRGPLIIEGAAGAGSLSLPAPLMLPGELNVRASHGTVVAFTPNSGGGAIETMTLSTQDLLDHLADVEVDSIAKLVGKTIELTQGPGTDVILDAERPHDLYDRFWLIKSIQDLGGGLTKLTLQNPSMVDPGQPNVTAPTTDSEFAITALSVNFFADEREQVDFATVYDQDSVSDDTGTLTSSDGNVLGFTASGGDTETMVVETVDLQKLGLPNNDLDTMVGKIIEITVGAGRGRKWTVAAIADGTAAGTKLLTLTKIAGAASGNPTNRSEFRVDGFDRHGRILGLGMGPNVVIGAGVQPGGITYGDMEVLQVNLGEGDDTIDVDYTTNAEGHTTKRSGDFYTLTMLNLGGGNDTVNARIDAAQDGDLAIRGQAGDDTIDATGSTLGIVAFGEDGSDTITGGAGQDSIFGDFGRVDFVDGEGEIITRLGHSIPLNPVNPPVVSATLTTITDPTANFTTEYGGLAGLMMQVIMPNGTVQFRRIVSNTATTITVDRDFDVLPVFGQPEPDENSAYRISALPENQGDGTYRGPRVVWSIDNGIGADDVINGGDGKDLLFGGAANDVIDAGAGDDVVAGDNARVDFTPVAGNDGPTQLVKISETGIGGDDSISGGADADLVIAGLGNDTVNGQAAADVLIGDRADVIYKADGVTIESIETTDRANGGDDRIYGNEADDVVIGGTGADALDGGSEKDLLFGDNVTLVNNVGSADAIKGRFRTVAGSTIYDANGVAQVGGPSNLIPGGTPAWADWAITLDQTPANFGNDYLAGGAGHDQIFGQLGNDTAQGDGSIDLTVSATQASVEDHNGAGTDGDDYIEGNAGDDVLLGNLGQDDLIGGSSNLFSYTTPPLRGDGADVIFGGAGTDLARNNLGDEAAAGHARDADFIIGDNGNVYRLVDAAGNYRTFTYDNYTTALKLIPRSVQHLDYTYGGNSASDIGGADLIHGESGDDSVYGTVGNDVLFGEGQDDDLHGGVGHDRIYGGGGEDGVLGDDGLIYTSRNGLTETLHGLNTVNALSNIKLPGPTVGAYIYITGRLNKAVKILAWTQGGNDVVYGGLGDDFLHGGAGNDAVSGAEATVDFYNDLPVTHETPIAYDPVTRKLAGFDANDPRSKIANFLLNFNATDAGGAKIEDGKDRLFGDLGHDWLVGGTGNDRMLGGVGDDLMNADDNHDTNGGLNDVPDAPAFADADFVYGGDGLDVLIGNTGADRLYDWSGEFNSFFVPFSQFGSPTVNRLILPGVPEFLRALGRESGADQSRLEPDGELGLFTQGDPRWGSNTGSPRDPQPGTTSAKIDTVGGPEDDRDTALPL